MNRYIKLAIPLATYLLWFFYVVFPNIIFGVPLGLGVGYTTMTLFLKILDEN